MLQIDRVSKPSRTPVPLFLLGSSSLLRNCRDTDASAAGVNGYRYPYWEEDEDFSPSFQIVSEQSILVLESEGIVALICPSTSRCKQTWIRSLNRYTCTIT